MVIQRLMGCFVGFSIKPRSPRTFTRLLINSREYKILLCPLVCAPDHLYLFAFIHTLRQSLMTNRQRYDDDNNNNNIVYAHLYSRDFMSRPRICNNIIIERVNTANGSDEKHNRIIIKRCSSGA